jgi:hypothetical protein
MFALIALKLFPLNGKSDFTIERWASSLVVTALTALQRH